MFSILNCRNICHYQIIFAMMCLINIISQNSLAISTSTLPSSIYSPAIRYGHIEGLDQRFTDSGSLVKLTDYKAIEFDAKTLARLNSQAQNLIASLNRFGAFGLGDSLNLGVLEIQTKPQINYTAPVLARGMTNRWTLALGVPVIHYQNNVKLSQSFSNIGYYKNQFSGLSAELDKALNTNIGESTQQALQAKGYRRLENRDEKFLGDLQLVSLYKIYEDTDLTIVHQATLSLPTGPRYDASDLLALNSFHKTSLENLLSLSVNVGSLWKVTPYTSFRLNLPEKIDARIPTNEEDILPDQNSTENIEKQEGLSLEVGLQNSIDLTDAFRVAIDYRLGVKAEDHYAGSRSGRYDLLAQNSNSRWQKASVEFVYSTVKSYLKKSSAFPFMLSVNFFDTLSGQNIERRVGQELSMTLFF